MIGWFAPCQPDSKRIGVKQSEHGTPLLFEQLKSSQTSKPRLISVLEFVFGGA
jgi:hypothetical protein